MPLKRSTEPTETETTEQNDENRPFEIKENPRVNARIDSYIKENPKPMAFLKSLSRERLERVVVLERIRSEDLHQKLNNGLFKKIDQNPALKQDYEALMKHVPEHEKERVSVEIARTLVFSQARTQKQQSGNGIST